jgi:putative membrane protein
MPGGGHGRGMSSWWMGGWGWLWVTLTVLVIALLIALLVVWITRRSGPTDRNSDRDGAVRILEERFARGEIDSEEFEERRRALRGAPP